MKWLLLTGAVGGLWYFGRDLLSFVLTYPH
jgi:hypothetical protein